MRIRALAIASCLVLGACLAPSNQADVRADEIRELRQENNALKAELRELKLELKAQIGVGNKNNENQAGGNIGLTGGDFKWLIIGQIVAALLQTAVIIAFVRMHGYESGKHRWLNKQASSSNGSGCHV